MAALRKYAVFSGRTARGEFWPFILINAFITLVIFGGEKWTDALLRQNADSIPLLLLQDGFLLAALLFLLSMVVPSIAITVRRLHDSGKTGWWYLIGFVPFVGGIVLLVLCARKGDAGANRFGPGVGRPEAGS